MQDVFIILTLVIIPQCILNHHIVYFKYIYFHLSFIPNCYSIIKKKMVRIGAILYIILYFEKKINILNMNIDTHIHVILILIIIIFDCVGSSLLCAGFL